MTNFEKLAKILVNYSCSIKKGDRVLIEQSYTDTDFLIALIREIKKAGGLPFIINIIPEIARELLLDMSEEYAKLKTEFMLPDMKEMDAYIQLDGANNIFETSDVPTQFLNINNLYYLKPVHFDQRVNHTNWVILRWPTPAFAQTANMSSSAFEELFFKVCTLDYGKMSDAMEPLVQLMNKTDKVRIKGQGTDISFSIKKIPAVKCAGKNNIPDGEIFTAPIKKSVNGTISYNLPTIYNGTRFDNVKLTVKDGKIINALAGAQTAKLNQILDLDEGSRYFGEFAFGVNPHLKTPLLDILFDEKICGSIHLTPGQCYKEAPNGNVSGIHWDMVLCQLKEYGGGEIYFDDKLIRKDGKFVIKELFQLNPENLV